MSFEWIIGLSAGILCGLVGAIYYAGQGRDDKQDARFDRNEQDFGEHVREGDSMHERIVRVETKVEKREVEVNKLRDMRHEILDRVTHTLAEWYVSIMDRINKK
jgi:hypothetical protein